jgi:hypothetical protein
MDWKYYLDTYPDLGQNSIHTEQQAIQHWNTYGKQEGRIPFFQFDWKYYLDTYPDLRQNGIHTEEQAIQHWNNHGKKEGRQGSDDLSILNKINYTTDNLNEYIRNYDTFNTIIVYDFNIGSGGIGDCIKFFMKLLFFCMYHNVQIKYQVNDIMIEKYLRLTHDKMYIKNHNYKKISPHIFYPVDSCDNIKIPLQELFCFTEEVKLNAYRLLPLENYISIHLRLGDKYLETDKKFIQVLNDERIYDEKKIYEYIESNLDKKLVFFCDNQSYKQKIKEKYTIFVANTNIGHTSLPNTSENQVLDAISEFYLLSNSVTIAIGTHSGFPIMASKFKNIPVFIFN